MCKDFSWHSIHVVWQGPTTHLYTIRMSRKSGLLLEVFFRRAVMASSSSLPTSCKTWVLSGVFWKQRLSTLSDYVPHTFLLWGGMGCPSIIWIHCLSSGFLYYEVTDLMNQDMKFVGTYRNVFRSSSEDLQCILDFATLPSFRSRNYWMVQLKAEFVDSCSLHYNIQQALSHFHLRYYQIVFRS